MENTDNVNLRAEVDRLMKENEDCKTLIGMYSRTMELNREKCLMKERGETRYVLSYSRTYQSSPDDWETY